MEFDAIFNEYKTEMVTISICRAADMDVLKPVLRLFNESKMTFHLVDDRSTIEKMLNSENEGYLSNERLVIHHADSDEEAAEIAVKLVSEGRADILMKGLISTSIILREVLNKSHGLKGDGLLSHVAFFDLPNYHKAILLSDAAMNIAPDAGEKAEILKNTLQCSYKLNMKKPKAAFLSAVEKVNEKLSSTTDAEAVKSTAEIKSMDVILDGPLQYDLAVSKQAAEHKGLESEVAGDVDILIAPDIEAGNILYKSLVYTAGARVASIITGARAPIVLTSRTDSAEDRYNSISLAIHVAK
ncbi:phosphate acyltransferase [Salinicoccus albus]|uniref:phosphate acyltransferase n=1 Tax=Salinicoccus albus TaxID=418756 RepID=UPI0003693BBD|nr:phosphate acyltransferase [Salinicoccus albus]